MAIHKSTRKLVWVTQTQPIKLLLHRDFMYFTQCHLMLFDSFPPEKYPVLAFTGAPAKFPVIEKNVRLHEYMQWSDYIADKAAKVIDTKLKRPYIGAHLRIGVDWVGCLKRVCNV